MAWNGICFAAVPNGEHRHIAVAKRLKLSGVAAGFPDLLILDPPPNAPDGKAHCGTALEMKRAANGPRGGGAGRLRPEQKDWLEKLAARGWATCVARGAKEAIEMLQTLGYTKKN